MKTNFLVSIETIYIVNWIWQEKVVWPNGIRATNEKQNHQKNFLNWLYTLYRNYTIICIFKIKGKFLRLLISLKTTFFETAILFILISILAICAVFFFKQNSLILNITLIGINWFWVLFMISKTTRRTVICTR